MQPSPAVLEVLEELQHGRVDVVTPLLLGPVAAAGEDQGLAELGNELREVGDELVHAAEGEHEVTVAGDVEGGDGDHGARIGSEELPVAIDVAIPVETAAKAGASKFPGVEVDVDLGEPGRQHLRLSHRAEKAASLRHHADAGGVGGAFTWPIARG